MSIWCSTLGFDADDHAFAESGVTCARWVPDDCAAGLERCNHGHLMFLSPGYGDPRRWRLDPDIACTCRCGPLRYHGSHVRPTVDGERAGSFSLAHVPGFITLDGYDDEADETPQEFLRLTTVAEPPAADLDYWTGKAFASLTETLGTEAAAEVVRTLTDVGALQGCRTVVDVVLDGAQVTELARELDSHLAWRRTGESAGVDS